MAASSPPASHSWTPWCRTTSPSAAHSPAPGDGSTSHSTTSSIANYAQPKLDLPVNFSLGKPSLGKGLRPLKSPCTGVAEGTASQPTMGVSAPIRKEARREPVHRAPSAEHWLSVLVL